MFSQVLYTRTIYMTAYTVVKICLTRSSHKIKMLHVYAPIITSLQL